MDKAQKQLVDTYFRKREIANEIKETDPEYEDEYEGETETEFRKYEAEYIINHNTGIKLDYRTERALIYGSSIDVLKKLNPNNLSDNALIHYTPNNIFSIFSPKIPLERFKNLDKDKIFGMAYNHMEIANELDLSKIDKSMDLYMLLEKIGYNFQKYKHLMNKINLDFISEYHKNLLLQQFPVELTKYFYK